MHVDQWDISGEWMLMDITSLGDLETECQGLECGLQVIRQTEY